MGLLSDFIGGVAGGASDYYGELYKQQRQDERDAKELEQKKTLLELQSQMDLKKQEAIEALKERMLDTKKANFVAASEKADGMVEQIGDDRRFAKFKRDMLQAGYGQQASGENTEPMSEGQMREVFNKYYNNTRTTNEEGGDRYMDRGRLDAAMDQYTAAKRTGNADLIDAEYKGVSAARAADAEDAKERRAENRDATRERVALINDEFNRLKLDASQNRFMAQLAENGRQANLTAQVTAAKATLTAAAHDMPKPPDPARGDRANKAYKEALAAWESTPSGQAYIESRDFLRAVQQASPSSEKATGGTVREEPQGKAAVGRNPDGSIQYGPASGKASSGGVTGKPNASEDDRIAILRSEHERAVRDGRAADAEAVARELKRLGVDVSIQPSSANSGGQSGFRIVGVR